MKRTTISKGFTLAEVLITIGIIGVVAAITIPNMITNYQKKQTVVKLQKSISVLNQAYRLSYNDLGEPDDLTISGSEYFRKYWAPYIKSALYCNNYFACGYSAERPFSDMQGNAFSLQITTDSDNRATFYTPDGVLYLIRLIDGAGKVVKQINIDINGGQKPNKLGKDVFYAVLLPDGKGILPYGATFNDAQVKNNCLNNNGQLCAEYIRRSGWKIPNDYKW